MELRRVGALPRSNADLAARIDGRIEDIKNRARVDEDGTPRGGDFSIPFNFLALVLPELLEPASSSKREATTDPITDAEERLMTRELKDELLLLERQEEALVVASNAEHDPWRRVRARLRTSLRRPANPPKKGSGQSIVLRSPAARRRWDFTPPGPILWVLR